MIRWQDYAFVTCLLMIGTVGIAINNTSTFYAGLIIFIIGVVHFVKDIDQNVFILVFMISFFTFLLGSEASILMGLKANKYFFIQEINYHAYKTLLVSLLFLFLSYVLTSIYLRKQNSNLDNRSFEELSATIVPIRRVSLYAFYFLLLFKIAVNLSEVSFSRAFSYSSLYTDYSFQGPGIILKLATMCTTAFFVYLGTLPTKRECRIPVILYICANAIIIFSGRRNDLIIAILLVFAYYCFRNIMYNCGDVWVSKRQIAVLVLLAPLLLSGLYAVSSLRSGNRGDVALSYLNGIVDFFYQQGFSINIIKWEKSLEGSIPDKIYSLGQTYEFFTTKNFFSRFLFDFQSYDGQTVERALQGHRLSHLLSYLVFPWSYSQGYGVGSCYIAEAYHDFGYFGVAAINSVYGCLFAKFNDTKYSNPIIIAISFIMMQELLFAPRSYADAFIGTVLDFSNIEILVLIWIVSRCLYNRNNSIKGI